MRLVKVETFRGVRGHAWSPGKILENLDCISRVFMVEKERKRVVKRRSDSSSQFSSDIPRF